MNFYSYKKYLFFYYKILTFFKLEIDIRNVSQFEPTKKNPQTQFPPENPINDFRPMHHLHCFPSPLTLSKNVYLHGKMRWTPTLTTRTTRSISRRFSFFLNDAYWPRFVWFLRPRTKLEFDENFNFSQNGRRGWFRFFFCENYRVITVGFRAFVVGNCVVVMY